MRKYVGYAGQSPKKISFAIAKVVLCFIYSILGTMGYVHSKCLNHWVNSKNGDLFNTPAMRNINRPNIPIKCDICGYVYDYVILREKINKANCLR